MIDKKFNSEELYILHISELIYYVPCDIEGAYYNTFYNQEYYTIASSKDEENFKDVFKFQKYKIDGYVGLGVMRDIKDILPLKSYDKNITELISRKELVPILDTFVNEIKNVATEGEDINKYKKLAL